MPMRVTCPNCGKQFSAWDDLIGKPVQCPKCQQTTILGGPNAALDPPAGSLATNKPAPPVKSPTTRPTGNTTGAGSSPPPGTPPAARAAPPASARPAAPPAGRPAAGRLAGTAPPSPTVPSSNAAGGTRRGDVPGPATPRTNVAPAAARVPPQGRTHQDVDDGDDRVPLGCPNCNAPMEPNDDLCDSCGYHLVLKKVIDISDMHKRSKSTGFERLLEDQLHDTETSQGTLIWIKLVAALLLVAVLFLCLGRWWWVGVLAVSGVIAYLWMAQRRRQAQRAAGESEVNQDPLSAAIWTLFLLLQRTVGWRRAEWPFAAAKTLTLHDPRFNDAELGDLSELGAIEALDLEGTAVSNDGLNQLRKLKQLKYLVVRRTQVTAAGVSKLQQELPHTMIWH